MSTISIVPSCVTWCKYTQSSITVVTRRGTCLHYEIWLVHLRTEHIPHTRYCARFWRYCDVSWQYKPEQCAVGRSHWHEREGRIKPEFGLNCLGGFHVTTWPNISILDTCFSHWLVSWNPDRLYNHLLSELAMNDCVDICGCLFLFREDIATDVTTNLAYTVLYMIGQFLSVTVEYHVFVTWPTLLQMVHTLLTIIRCVSSYDI